MFSPASLNSRERAPTAKPEILVGREATEGSFAQNRLGAVGGADEP